MDEFLRSASHSIVTTVLMVIWGGLLLGVIWKILSHLWSVLHRLLPGRTFPTVKELYPQRPRLSVSVAPALVANNPESFLSEVPRPLLLPPQDGSHCDVSPLHEFVIALFLPHNYRTPSGTTRTPLYEPLQSHHYPLCRRSG